MRLRAVPTFNPLPPSPRTLAPTQPQTLTVKAVVDTIQDTSGNDVQVPRIVYDMADTPIPHENFVTTPLTASLVLAIQQGDVVEEEPTIQTDQQKAEQQKEAQQQAAQPSEPTPTQP